MPVAKPIRLSDKLHGNTGPMSLEVSWKVVISDSFNMRITSQNDDFVKIGWSAFSSSLNVEAFGSISLGAELHGMTGFTSVHCCTLLIIGGTRTTLTAITVHDFRDLRARLLNGSKR